MKFELPKMPYSYDALEPHIDARTMEIHYTKHHQGYTDNLNKALETPEGQSLPDSIEEILANINKVPDTIRSTINFHGGGYINHILYFYNMSPNGGGEPGGKVGDAIDSVFGNFEKFKENFSKDSVAIQGSGWGWLVFNPKNKKVEFVTTPNQTSPITMGLIPVLSLDVWEHCYYLLRQNRRAEYVAAWWNVVNWDDVEKNLESV